MSTIFKDIGTVDQFPSCTDSNTRIFGRTVGKTTFRTGLGPQDRNESNVQLRSNKDIENMPDRSLKIQTLGRISSLQGTLNQDLRSMNHDSISSVPRTFGLQSRNPSMVSLPQQEHNLRLNEVPDDLHHRGNISTVSKTFGLISEDLNKMSLQNNGRYNQELRMNVSCSSSLMPRPFGLHARTSHINGFAQDGLRGDRNTNVMNYRRNNLSTTSRICLGPDNMGGLISRENELFNENLKHNSGVNSSEMLRSFGLQSRTSTLNPKMNLRMNDGSTHRSNNMSTIPKTFGPSIRSRALATGLSMQESTRYNDDIVDNGGFRKPMLSSMIRGRSSTLGSRLFQNQNTKRYCKDLSNINGFNVSHISMRDVETQSESRLALNMRSNWFDNQSMSGSVLSAVSMKSQFMNLLENLHHSILNIGPQLTAEAVRMEFDRAKQRLENINEISFAPSVKENGPASIISHSSKYICPPITEPSTSTCIDGGSLHLKSSKELLKTLILGKDAYKGKFNLPTHLEEERELGKLAISSSQNNKSDAEEEDSPLVFKKPRPYTKKKKTSSRILKMTHAVKNITSMKSSKVINLKQWYPIAVGSDLAFCGVDDEGATVKTEAVKKRLNNRKVELINGLSCNLIGNPSVMVSVLPQKIMGLLKNGLTDRWRVLQKELLTCQTAEQEAKKRISKSPNVRKSPEKKTNKSPAGKRKENNSKILKVTSTPKKKGKELHTRSGRAVKPPSTFWIVNIRNAEVSARSERPIPELTANEKAGKGKPINASAETVKKSKKSTCESPKKKFQKIIKESPVTKTKKLNDSSFRKLKSIIEESPSRKAKASPQKSKKINEILKSPKKELLKAKSPKMNKKEEIEGNTVQVHSSTGDVKREKKTSKVQGKRKRDLNADVDSVLPKKSKLEKQTEVEVESTVQTTSKTVSKKGRRKKSGLTLSSCSAKTTPKQKTHSPAKNKKRTVKKKVEKNKSESKTETKEVNEFEEDFELQLNDIEIPEIGHLSGNPQLSRSQMKLISMETPPLKYFNTHLNLLRNATPVRSPVWCISQRTESEVKQFQKRREEALKKKIKVNNIKTVITEKSKNVQSRDVKRVMEWVAEKTMRSPQWNSKVLQYVIPSRKQLEERMNDEEDEIVESEFL